MKKILYASTALIATAGVAAAEVSFGGYGRFGIGYLESRGNVPGQEDLVIVSRFRLNIDAGTETDGGVRFSARVRLQADEASTNSVPGAVGDTFTGGEANRAGLNGARFSAIYGGIRVDVGNVSGAFDNLPNYYGNEPGMENFVGQYSAVNYGFMGYSTNATGANGVYVQYAFGDFSVAASYDSADLITAVNAAGVATAAVSRDRWDVSASYSFGSITAALAYGETDGVIKRDLTVLTLGGSWGPLSATFLVGDESTGVVATSDTFFGLSGAYDLSSATTIVASFGDGSGAGDRQQLGVGVVHDLGGGVTLRGGIGQSKTGAAPSRSQADFGVRFNF